jgi:hypothetical protein
MYEKEALLRFVIAVLSHSIDRMLAAVVVAEGVEARVSCGAVGDLDAQVVVVTITH